MKHVETAAKLLTAPCAVLRLFAACSSGTTAHGTDGESCEGADCPRNDAGGGGSEAGTGSDTGGGSSGGDSGGSSSSSGGGSDASTGVDTGGGGGDPGSGDADMSYDATGSADVQWGEPCLYNFGSSCPFSNPQECGNHQAIAVTFPNGAQLLNATLFAGLDCSTTALNDNFNDQQSTMGTGIWMFTDDADVAGVSASNPTSAIWWVGPLTASGYPSAGTPTTGCINYTSAMAMCQ